MYIYDNHELQACFTMSSITRITSSSFSGKITTVCFDKLHSFSGKISLSRFRISICFDKSMHQSHHYTWK